MSHFRFKQEAASWGELERKIASIPSEKERGDAFEEFCEAYLRLIPEYRFKDIWLQGRYPRWVIDKLRLIGQKDQGIDLVALTEDGKLWAIQAKFRSDRAATVPYRELSTFLGISDQADYRLIISNTQILPTVVQRRGHCGEVLADRLDALDSDFFKRLAELAQGQKPEPVKPFTPKEHQKHAIQAAVKHFAKEARGQLIMACGTGKTLTSVWIAEHLNSKAILVMVPSLALMRQTVSVWAKNYKKAPFKYFCVCSDDSVAHDIKSDYAVSHLWEMDIPVTTDPLEAGRVIRHYSGTPFIVFSTYQSSIVLSKAVSRVKGFGFDLIISDEAHRTAGMTQGLFNHVLDDKHIPSRKRLFMTATPRILAKHIVKKGMDEDVELFSMADETKYGREFYRVSFSEAIKRKLLTDYKVVIAVITDEELRQIVQRKARVQVISKQTYEREAESLAKQVAYLKALKNYGIRHTISYHSRVSFAQAFSAPDNACGIHAVNQLVKLQEKDAPELQAFHVNGMMPAGERLSILKDFAEASFSVVSNARCLTEGVDIPSVDGVLFFDPKYRLTDIVQATGRAIRLHPGKEYGYLIVPVFIKKDEDVEAALESSDFSQVWSVIKAMQSQDERLDEVISKLRTLDGEIKGGNLELSSTRQSTEEKLFEKIQIFNVPRKVSARNFVRFVETRLLENLGKSWDYWYGLLLEFRRKHPNRWPVRGEEHPSGNRIGQWCGVQRTLYQDGKLSKERISLLGKMNFEWVPFDAAWDEQYHFLLRFRKRFPERWPPQSEEFPKGNKLGTWCNTQKIKYKKAQLSKKRELLLEKIGFEWNLTEAQWQEQYERLILFRKRHPNRWPAQNEEYPKGEKLGIWCGGQRLRFHKKKLSSKQVLLLEKIGFPWSPLEDAWKKQYEYLVEYRKINPTKWPVQFHEYPRGNRLGDWCQGQRHRYRANRLSQEKMFLLEKIGFEWNPYSVAWQEQYRHLVNFRKNNSNEWPPQAGEYPKGNLLGKWCQVQRSLYRRKQLNSQRVQLLAALNFPWNPYSLAWNKEYQHLIVFRKKRPNRWPFDDEQCPRGNYLGKWCQKQRANYRANRLSKERRLFLERLGFDWNPINSTWQRQYDFLEKFRNEHPNRWPTAKEEYPEGNKLGSWCSEQRNNCKRERLSPERISLLNKVGFEWDLRRTSFEKRRQ